MFVAYVRIESCNCKVCVFVWSALVLLLMILWDDHRCYGQLVGPLYPSLFCAYLFITQNQSSVNHVLYDNDDAEFQN